MMILISFLLISSTHAVGLTSLSRDIVDARVNNAATAGNDRVRGESPSALPINKIQLVAKHPPMKKIERKSVIKRLSRGCPKLKTKLLHKKKNTVRTIPNERKQVRTVRSNAEVRAAFRARRAARTQTVNAQLPVAPTLVNSPKNTHTEQTRLNSLPVQKETCLQEKLLREKKEIQMRLEQEKKEVVREQNLLFQKSVERWIKILKAHNESIDMDDVKDLATFKQKVEDALHDKKLLLEDYKQDGLEELITALGIQENFDNRDYPFSGEVKTHLRCKRHMPEDKPVKVVRRPEWEQYAGYWDMKR